jgi:hypothetical protein
VWHHSRAHRLFTNARWSGDAVELALAVLIVARLLPGGAALTIAVDDTLFKRSGKKVFGVAWHHDGAAKGPKPIASPTPTIWRASAKACSRTVSGRLTSSFAASRSAGRR